MLLGSVESTCKRCVSKCPKVGVNLFYSGSTSCGNSAGENLVDQLAVTRGKMEQLRRIMEERKARRRARREARAAPYSTSWSVKSDVNNDESSSDDSSATDESSAAASPAAAATPATAAADNSMFNNEPEPVTA